MKRLENSKRSTNWHKRKRLSLFGRVAYTPGVGVDASVSVVRFDYASSMDNDNPGFNPKIYLAKVPYSPFSLLPLWNYQGISTHGVVADGGGTSCKGAPNATYPVVGQSCIKMFWLGMSSAYLAEIGFGIWGVWHGSLLEDKRDASGLL